MFLMRHGLTQYNVEKRTMGKIDLPLIESGREELEFLKDQVSFEIDYIFTSPMKRAVETADIINKKTKSKIIICNKLREFDYGIWDGMTIEEISNKFPNDLDIYLNKPEIYYAKNGDSISNKYEECVMFINENKKILQQNKCLIISHAMTLKLILCYLENCNLKKVWDLQSIKNGEIIERILS